MRGVSKSFVRSFAVVVLTTAVAVTAVQADTRHQESGAVIGAPTRAHEGVVERMKKMIVRIFGGDISVPNPEPVLPPNTTT